MFAGLRRFDIKRQDALPCLGQRDGGKVPFGLVERFLILLPRLFGGANPGPGGDGLRFGGGHLLGDHLAYRAGILGRGDGIAAAKATQIGQLRLRRRPGRLQPGDGVVPRGQSLGQPVHLIPRGLDGVGDDLIRGRHTVHRKRCRAKRHACGQVEQHVGDGNAVRQAGDHDPVRPGFGREAYHPLHPRAFGKDRHPVDRRGGLKGFGGQRDGEEEERQKTDAHGTTPCDNCAKALARTPQKARVCRAAGLSDPSGMAAPAGFEPATYRLGGGRSIP